MSAVSIRAVGVGKRYDVARAIDPHRTLREALVESVGGMLDAIRPTRSLGDAS